MTAKRKRKRGHDATGRSRSKRFVLLEHPLLNSAAWLSLKCEPRALYVELRRRFNGANNGKISLAVREAAKLLHIAKDTATKAFRELEAKGFIRANQRGDFNWKERHATTWILTEENFGDSLPTKEFMRWQPEKSEAGPKIRTYGPKSGTKSDTNAAVNGSTVPKQGPKPIS